MADRPEEKTIPLAALRASRNQARTLKAQVAEMKARETAVQALLQQLGFSISAASTVGNLPTP
jgi:hypothetical protein